MKGIEKMLGWLEALPEGLYRRTEAVMIARGLLKEEQEQKPTADGSLIEELQALYDRANYNHQLALKVVGAFDIKDLLLRYTPVPPPVEQKESLADRKALWLKLITLANDGCGCECCELVMQELKEIAKDLEDKEDKI